MVGGRDAGGRLGVDVPDEVVDEPNSHEARHPEEKDDEDEPDRRDDRLAESIIFEDKPDRSGSHGEPKGRETDVDGLEDSAHVSTPGRVVVMD